MFGCLLRWHTRPIYDKLLFTTNGSTTVNTTKYTIENDLTRKREKEKYIYIQTNGMYLFI